MFLGNTEPFIYPVRLNNAPVTAEEVVLNFNRNIATLHQIYVAYGGYRKGEGGSPSVYLSMQEQYTVNIKMYILKYY